LFFEGLASSVHADGGVACGDSHFFCEGDEACFSQINFAEDFAVGGIHGEEDFVDALADDLLGFRVWRGFGEVVGPALEGTIFGSAATVVVDDCVAQDAVEPGDSGLFTAERGACSMARV
jgi:hypothetical protein